MKNINPVLIFNIIFRTLLTIKNNKIYLKTLLPLFLLLFLFLISCSGSESQGTPGGGKEQAKWGAAKWGVDKWEP